MRPRTALDIFVLWLEPERIPLDVIVNVHWCSCKVRVLLVKSLIKLKFSEEVFEKYFHVNFHGTSSF
jgi:hypothetical protein